MLGVSILWEVMLLVFKGVPFSGCGLPSSMHVMRIGQPCFAPRYTPPVTA